VFFFLKSYFTKEVNAVKKIQEMGHPTVPGRYMTECSILRTVCYISGEGASRDAFKDFLSKILNCLVVMHSSLHGPGARLC